MFFSRSVFFSAIAGAIIQASSVVSISSQCQSALLSIAASPDAQCIDASGLTGLFLQSSSSSVISPVDSWLHGVCPLGTCSNTTLAALVANVTSGCSTDLSSVIGSISTSQLTAIVQGAYPTVRKVACLQDQAANNGFCVTETLTNIQSTTGTLTLAEVSTLLNTIVGGGSISLPENTTCTSCTKEAYNIINTDYPGLISSSSVQQTCGTNFTDGAVPSSVVQTAGNATSSSSSSTSGASSISNVHASLYSIVVGSLVLAVVV